MPLKRPPKPESPKTADREPAQPGPQFASEKDFNEWRMQTGFGGGFHGTYRHETGAGYLYVKRAHRVETPQQTTESLAMLRDLTQKGVLYPGTVWGAYDDGQKGTQLFALTPTLHQDLESPQQPPSFSGADSYAGMLDEGSHILEWCRRVDPAFDPNDFSPASPVLLLNPVEAAHRDNWAWDETGTLYPIDVEVVNVAAHADIVHEWYETQ